MASCSSLTYEDQVLCSICLDVFKEPVTTPCGHNYCKSCITGYWDCSNQTRCPLCKKRFRHRPILKTNTGFRDIVEHLKNISISPGDECHVKPGEVACDICVVPKLKALKTCLVCLASYCQLHLEPHERVSNLKKHTLTDPVSNLDDRVCKKHDKMFELFCTVDQMCVCFMCLKDDHAGHETVPLECAFRDEKAYIENGIAEIKMMENAKSRSVNRIRSSIEQSNKDKNKDIADIGEVFTTLVDLLQRNRDTLVEIIEQNHKEAVKIPEESALQLEKEISKLKQQRSEMEQLLKTEDHLQVLLCKPSLHIPSHNEDLNSLSHSISPLTEYHPVGHQSYLNTVKTAGEDMEKMLSNQIDRLVHKVQYPNADGDDSDTEESVKEAWTPPKDKLMMIQQNDTVDVTLDSYTAHAHLSVFEEGKSLMYNPFISQEVRSSFFTRRFENQPFVLGQDGFSSGRFYYEVEVSGATEWVLGVARETVSRDMSSRTLPGTGDGAWLITTLTWYNGDCYFIPEYLRPQRVGVFVDYEKGEVSFYNVDARNVIYSYTECTFSNPASLLKSLLYSLGGASVSNRTKLYPICGTFNYFDILKITPLPSAL